MEEKLTQIFTVWGWKGLVIVAAVFVLSFLIKWPIKKWAVKMAEEGNIADKKVVTKWFFVIPIVVSFALTLLCELWTEWNWDFSKIDWRILSTGTLTFAVAPAAIYEWFDAFYKSGQATAIVKSASKDAESVVSAKPIPSNPKVLARQGKRVNAKVEKLEKKKAKIQTQINQLRGVKSAIAANSEPTQGASVDKFGNVTFK